MQRAEAVARKPKDKLASVSTLIWTKEMAGRLKSVRLGAGLKQEDLAMLLGVNRSALSRVESGLLEYLPVTVERLRFVLGSTFNFVVNGRAMTPPKLTALNHLRDPDIVSKYTAMSDERIRLKKERQEYVSGWRKRHSSKKSTT